MDVNLTVEILKRAESAGKWWISQKQLLEKLIPIH
jgi:hypothetical protein